jgi:hypothetical protein
MSTSAIDLRLGMATFQQASPLFSAVAARVQVEIFFRRLW